MPSLVAGYVEQSGRHKLALDIMGYGPVRSPPLPPNDGAETRGARGSGFSEIFDL